jgi:ABC-type uncharacterized transport system substrate-binding protein
MAISPTMDLAQLITQVKAAAPDVVVNNVEVESVIAALKDLTIPVCTRYSIDRYVNADGIPTGNVTGVYTMLPDMVYNSYKFLQKVAPLKEVQSVVFLDNPQFALLSKDAVVDALQRLQIPLKTVVNVMIYEDFQQAVLQYNDDPEVGWILRSSPTQKRDGSSPSLPNEVYPWLRANLKKPTISYWESAVQRGTLCAFGVDRDGVSRQVGAIAARVLKGEDIHTIKAEYPNKVSIALNRKTATTLGIVFSLDVLNLANVIYDDYEGKQVIRK